MDLSVVMPAYNEGDHIYTNLLNTDEILSGLGTMYGSGGEFTQNINEAAGEGAAEFAAAAIKAFCS